MPQDVQSHLNFRKKYTDGVDDKLAEALTVSKITEYIVNETDSALTEVLNDNAIKIETKLVDVVYITPLTLTALEKVIIQHLREGGVQLIQNFLQDCHSPCVLDELIDRLSQKIEKKVNQTKLRSIREEVRHSLIESNCIHNEEAWLKSYFIPDITQRLSFAFRKSAEPYTGKNCSCAANEIFEDDNQSYLLKFTYKHNLWRVIAEGLQNTIVKSELKRINIPAKVYNLKSCFTYTDGLSYFWVEESFNKRIVTLADIRKINFANWDDDRLLKCFTTAIASPFTLHELCDFLELNVSSSTKMSYKLGCYLKVANDVITGQCLKYLPVLMQLDSLRVTDYILFITEHIDSQDLYNQLSVLKAALDTLNNTEMRHLLTTVRPSQFLESHKRFSENNPRNLTETKIKIFLIANSAYFLSPCEQGVLSFIHDNINSNINVGDFKLVPQEIKEDKVSFFHAVVISGCIELVDYFLAQESLLIYLNVRTEKQNLSLLHCAVIAGKYDLGLKLIKHSKFDVNLLTIDGKDALSICLEKKIPEVIGCIRELIVCQRIDSETVIKTMSQLFINNRRKYDEIVQDMLKQDDPSYFKKWLDLGLINIDKVDSSNTYILGCQDHTVPILHAAAELGSASIVNHILTMKIPETVLNEQENQLGFSALHSAIHFGHFRIALKFITEDKFNVNMITLGGEHALSMCLKEIKPGMCWFVKAFIRCKRVNFETKVRGGEKLKTIIADSIFGDDYFEVLLKNDNIDNGFVVI